MANLIEHRGFSLKKLSRFIRKAFLPLGRHKFFDGTALLKAAHVLGQIRSTKSRPAPAVEESGSGFVAEFLSRSQIA